MEKINIRTEWKEIRKKKTNKYTIERINSVKTSSKIDSEFLNLINNILKGLQ